MPKNKRTKVIIDTNLFISFLIGKQFKGLKDLLVDRKIELIFATQIILELRIVTQRPKFKKYFNIENINDLIDLIYSIGIVIEIDGFPDVCRDSKDNFLLELASKSKADFLITGDKDLLEINTYKTTKIITLNKFEKTIGNRIIT